MGGGFGATNKVRCEECGYSFRANARRYVAGKRQKCPKCGHATHYQLGFKKKKGGVRF